MLHKCNKCEYQSNRRYNLKVHLKNKHEDYILPTYPDNISNKMIHKCNKCEYFSTKCKQKNMKNEDARKVSVDEIRDIIIDCFDGFPEYMMMKSLTTEDDDEQRIE